MLYNKNEARKISRKPILHKVHKNWIVISSALLLALAGGAAVSSQTSANADNNNQSNVQENENDFLNRVDNNSNINSNNNATIHSLVGNNLVNAPASSAASKASAKSASSASSQWYWKWNGGSAQSYYANASSDANVASNESKIVNSYVKSVNAHFPSETSSLNASLGNAQSKLTNDKSAAASYSAIANNSNYSSEVNSLAASAGMTNSAYVESVEYEASSYDTAVSNGSVLNSEMTSVNSYANLLDSIANGNSAVKDEYKEAALSANASESDASLVYSNAVNNLKAYNSNVANSKGLDFAEKIALGDSVIDSQFVQSVANQLHTNRDVISSEVRSYATSSDPIGEYTSAVNDVNIEKNGTQSSADFVKNHAVTGSFVGSNGNNTQYYNVGTGYTAVFYDYLNGATSNVSSNGAAGQMNGIEFSDANNNNGSFEYVDNTASALVRVISNTSVMYAYDAERAAYGKNNAKYASASSALNSASVAYADAETSANYYDVLSAATDETANDALNLIFGNGESGALSLMDASTDSAANAGSTAYSAATHDVGTNPGTAAKNVNDVYNDLVAASNAITLTGEPNTSADNDIKKVASDVVASAKASSASDTAAGDNAATKNAKDKAAMISAANAGASAAYKVATDVTAKTAANNSATKSVGDVYNDLSNAAKAIDGGNNSAANDVVSAAKAESSVAGTPDVKNTTSNTTNISLMMSAASKAASAAKTVATDVTAKADANNAGTPNTPIIGIDNLSGINSLTNSAASEYTEESNASVAYANTTDANIALAPYYAASYAGDIKPDEAAVTTASNAQENFYADHAGSNYASAEYQASSASDANINDAALAQAYGINVYNNVPKYIRAIKGARIHSDTNFGSKGDKIMGTIPAGDEMTVEGIGLDVHGALRYNIYYKGANYFVTGNANYVTPTFLNAENNVSIVVNKPVKEYTDANFTKPAGKTLSANAQVSGDIIRMDNFNNGFTRVHLSNGNYISANTNYVAKVANNDDQQNNINGQNINHYINNANNNNNNHDAPITWGI